MSVEQVVAFTCIFTENNFLVLLGVGGGSDYRKNSQLQVLESERDLKRDLQRECFLIL